MLSMNHLCLILGGVRSGKSRFALKLGNRLGSRKGGQKVFLATAQPFDEEMAKRIEMHKRDRGKDWQSIEAPIKLTEMLQSLEGRLETKSKVVVIDCLTLWLNNLLMETEDSEKIIDQIDALIATIEKSEFNLIAVSNEVGLGIVPTNPLSRRFRDLAGLLHQEMAAISDEVYWMTAGIPMLIKGKS